MEYILNEPLMDPAAFELVWGNCVFEPELGCEEASIFDETEFHISNILLFYYYLFIK